MPPPMPSSTSPIAPTQPGVSLRSACGVVHPGLGSLCRAVAAGTITGTVEHQNNSINTVILVHPIAPIWNAFLIDARVPAGATRGPTRAQKGERFPVPGIGCFEQKQPVAVGLLLINFDLFYSVAINNCQTLNSTFPTTYLFE